MIKVNINDAIGKTLAHDLSRFVEGVADRTPLRKGHIIQKEDIALLLAMGKENLFVMEEGKVVNSAKIHEEEAAHRLAAICRNTGIVEAAVKEGKIELFADIDGLFRVNVERQKKINSIEGVIIATRTSLFPVHKGDKLAAVKTVPLEIDDHLLCEAEAIADNNPVLELLPYKLKSAGVVITGSEVQKGITKDAFAPLLVEKLKIFGIQITKKIITGDGAENIANSIAEVRSTKPDIILCTGGMSVDPDDNTPGAIIQSGAKPVCYGTPLLPGSMMMLAYFEDALPIMGVPGGALYKKNRAGILDIVLPRLAAGIKMTKEDFIAMGNGGLCLDCPICNYPVCTYGKAV
ncbi:MAG: molybdopterin-binding protein [Termitinemataceae bacterium]|nr:MAG: molybdopterin-binding protein [Termitinemataceae bacterium]